MAIADTAVGFDILESDELTVLSDDGKRHDLADDLELIVSGELTDNGHYVQFTVRFDPEPESVRDKSHTMVAEEFAPASLSNEAARGRFLETVERLYPGSVDVRSEIEGILIDLGEAHAAGELLICDSKAGELIRATQRVEYRPTASKQWAVTLTSEHKSIASFGTVVAEFKATDWATGAAHGLNKEIPGSLGSSPFADQPERWRTVRSVWQLLAETSA